MDNIDDVVFESGEEFGVVLGTGFRVFRKMLLPMLPLIVLVAVPLAIVCELLPYDSWEQAMHMPLKQAEKFESSIANMLQSLFMVFITLPGMVAASRVLRGRSFNCWEALGAGLRRFLPALWTGVLVSLAFVGLIFFFMLPLIVGSAMGHGEGNPLNTVYVRGLLMFLAFLALAFGLYLIIRLGVRWAFVMVAVVVGGRCGKEAIRESATLVPRGRILATLGVQIVAGLVSAVITVPGVIVAAIGVITCGSSPTLTAAFQSVMYILSFVGTMYTLANTVVFYHYRRQTLMRPASDADAANAEGAESEEIGESTPQ